MARRMSSSQIRSRIRQAQQKQRQAINRVNQSIRKYNREVKRAVDNYNREVRAHNARVRANRRRLRSELSRLSSQPVSTTRFVLYRQSVHSMHESYARLESRFDANLLGQNYNRILDLSERETANSLEVANHILGSDFQEDNIIDPMENADIQNNLRTISGDLVDRWQGAVYSLNHRNPDAARHFCTSAREIISQILEIKAPDSDVFGLLPECEVTELGKPTRRSKIKYFLTRNDLGERLLEDFVEEDLDNIVQLFRVFNVATHGSAGKFDLVQLSLLHKSTSGEKKAEPVK